MAIFFLLLPLPSVEENIHKIQNLDSSLFFFTAGCISSTSLGRYPNSSIKTFRIFCVIIICCPASSELVAIVVKTGAAISLSSEADWAGSTVKIQMTKKNYNFRSNQYSSLPLLLLFLFNRPPCFLGILILKIKPIIFLN